MTPVRMIELYSFGNSNNIDGIQLYYSDKVGALSDALLPTAPLWPPAAAAEPHLLAGWPQEFDSIGSPDAIAQGSLVASLTLAAGKRRVLQGSNSRPPLQRRPRCNLHTVD
jgi:hypothetical protein